MFTHPEKLPIPLLPCATLAIWLLCVIAGLVGLRIPYPRPAAPAPELQTQLLQADLPKDTTPPPPSQPIPQPEPTAAQPDIATPAPAAPPPAAIPQAPAITPVAAPSAAIAFAVPVAGLTKIVDISQAAHGAPTGSPSSSTGSGTAAPPPPPKPPPTLTPLPPAPPAVTHITLGIGEGRQPLPEYPHDALAANQQGNVGIRFTTGPDGRPAAVEVTTPSRWPLLNQAALRQVKSVWGRDVPFTPGKTYEYVFEFTIK